MIHFQKRNLRIEKVEEAKIYLARNDLNTDTGKTFLLKTQKFGRTGSHHYVVQRYQEAG